MSLAVVLLAAGKGTRMKSKRQKILHEVGGKPMVMHVFEAAEQVATLPPILVVGPGADGVRQLVGARGQYVEQTEQLGTGHATMVTRPLLEGNCDQVMVTYGDMPLLRGETLQQLAQTQVEKGATVTMTSVMGEPSSSFGRVVRDSSGRVTEIVEVAEAKQRPNTEELLNIRELNVGVYCFDAAWLWTHIESLPLRQARSGHEYYLTDMVALAVQQGLLVEAIVIEDADECLGAGTRAELVSVEKAFRHRANRHWLERGVTLVDPDTTYIDPNVTIGQDTVIWPNSYVQGNSVIGEDCVIGPNAIVRDAQLGDGCVVEQGIIIGTHVAAGTTVRGVVHEG